MPLASLLALEAWFCPNDDRVVRAYSAGDLGVTLCHCLTDYGCRIMTTWLCGQVKTNAWSNAALLPAGSFPAVADHGQLPAKWAGLASIRAALHIPDDVKTLLLCDWSLIGYPSKKVPGSVAGRLSPVTILRERHPSAIYDDTTVDVCALVNFVQLLRRIPTESRADCDHTLVVAMFLRKQKNK